jgi:hypothetical protein
MDTAMGTVLTQIPLSPNCNSREKKQARMSRKLTEADKVAVVFFNAIVLSTLRQGKQLQLWDSNVHRITTQGSRYLQIPADYHI